MHLALTPEQQELATVVGSLLDRRSDSAAVRAAMVAAREAIATVAREVRATSRIHQSKRAKPVRKGRLCRVIDAGRYHRR